jgi:hypothetical protein
MYKLTDFKEQILITDKSVDCPIKSCNIKVDRQRKDFKRLDNFKCPIHNIYISPSTIEYESDLDNLLWIDKQDQALLYQIKTVKRESRISRDNSEDAVTWNVFRFFERNKSLDDFLSLVSSDFHSSIELILWSYSQKEQKGWSHLDMARLEFGENIKRGSEPDIIILTDKTLFFIEAKINASNKTTPSEPNNLKKYTVGGQKWFSKVFKSDYSTIAITDKKYELMRFWLIGTWIAKELNIDFHLVNLVLNDKELLIDKEFGKHIICNSHNRFSRLSWESIYNLIKDSNKSNSEADLIIDYYKTKSAGYDSNGRLKRTFKTIK